MLDISKIEAGKIEITYEPINLRALIFEIQQIFLEKAKQKELQLLVNIDP